jgi:hypothetical protein
VFARSRVPLPRARRLQRDREILKGIAPTGPRSYPLRKGETVADVLKGRGVTMAEAQKLNAGIDLAKAKDGQIIKLPYGRYTQREKEMLSSVVPASSLGLAGVAVPSGAQLQAGLLVALAIAGYGFYVKARAPPRRTRTRAQMRGLCLVSVYRCIVLRAIFLTSPCCPPATPQKARDWAEKQL